MKNIPIEGHDIAEAKPTGGNIFVGGFIRSPSQIICIRWEVDGASGLTKCEAWQGQYEIERLAKAGYRIEAIALA